MGSNKKLTDEDDALLAELGFEIEAKKAAGPTAREERIIKGFEEIQKFFKIKAAYQNMVKTKIFLKDCTLLGLTSYVNEKRVEAYLAI